MYKISNGICSAHSCDGGAILDARNGHILRLNLTGSMIFQKLKEGKAEAQIAGEISRHFDVSLAVARFDLNEFLRSLEQHGLICSETPGSNS